MTLRLTVAEFERLRGRRKAPAPGARAGRRWEDELAAQLHDAGIHAFVREHRFIEDRRFRFDFAFPLARLAVEVDGAVHRTKKRFHADREKGQLATLGHWRVLHVSPAEVRSGFALTLVQKALRS